MLDSPEGDKSHVLYNRCLLMSMVNKYSPHIVTIVIYRSKTTTILTARFILELRSSSTTLGDRLMLLLSIWLRRSVGLVTILPSDKPP